MGRARRGGRRRNASTLSGRVRRAGPTSRRRPARSPAGAAPLRARGRRARSRTGSPSLSTSQAVGGSGPPGRRDPGVGQCSGGPGGQRLGPRTPDRRLGPPPSAGCAAADPNCAADVPSSGRPSRPGRRRAGRSGSRAHPAAEVQRWLCGAQSSEQPAYAVGVGREHAGRWIDPDLQRRWRRGGRRGGPGRSVGRAGRSGRSMSAASHEPACRRAGLIHRRQPEEREANDGATPRGDTAAKALV